MWRFILTIAPFMSPGALLSGPPRYIHHFFNSRTLHRQWPFAPSVHHPAPALSRSLGQPRVQATVPCFHFGSALSTHKFSAFLSKIYIAAQPCLAMPRSAHSSQHNVHLRLSISLPLVCPRSLECTGHDTVFCPTTV